MNFEFSDEQEMLRDHARRFLTENEAVRRARDVLEGEQAFDKDLWRQMAELGWLGTAISEDDGGIGLGYLELCVIAEELGRSLAPVPFASTIYLAAEVISQMGSDAQRKEWLAQIAAGDCIAALALAEQPGPLVEKNISAQVENGLLSGEKISVTDAAITDVLIVAARDGDGVSFYLVPTSDNGVACRAQNVIDPSRPQYQVIFSGSKAEKLAGADNAWQTLEAVFDRAAILMAFEQVGGATSCLEMAKDYALDRYAFGRPIASYQAIKHKLADVYTAIEIARSNAYYGAWALSTEAAELPIAAATARVAGIQAFYQASKENIQTHGGMGFTWAFDCHLYYRRSKHLALALGSERRWKDKLISELQKKNAA